jgi:hypothetical protein
MFPASNHAFELIPKDQLLWFLRDFGFGQLLRLSKSHQKRCEIFLEMPTEIINIPLIVLRCGPKDLSLCCDDRRLEEQSKRVPQEIYSFNPTKIFRMTASVIK